MDIGVKSKVMLCGTAVEKKCWCLYSPRLYLQLEKERLRYENLNIWIYFDHFILSVVYMYFPRMPILGIRVC